jgi:hypothetical protein
LSQRRPGVNIVLSARRSGGGARGMAESIEHKGYTIALLGGAGGWRVYIRPPTAAMMRAELPATLSREQAIAAATHLVDEAIAAARPARGRR